MRSNSMWLLVALPLLVLFVSSGSTTAADKPAEPDRQLTESVLQGVLNERQNFKSGVAEFSGSRQLTNEGKPDITATIVGLIAFKLAGDKLRYDYEEPQFVTIIEVGRRRPNDDKPIRIPRRLCYLRNSEYSAQWALYGAGWRSNIILNPPAAGVAKTRASHHPMYDIRSAGLIDFSMFETGPSLQAVIDQHLDAPVSKANQDGDRAILEWDLKDKHERLVVETRNGFRPVEYSVSSKTDSLRSISKIEWKRLGETDVPTQITVDRTLARLNHHIHYTVQYNWKKSINKPVNPRYFDYHDFRNIPADGAIQVIDQRSGFPQHIGNWIGNGIIGPPNVP